MSSISKALSASAHLQSQVLLSRGQAYVGAFLKAKDEESSGAEEAAADAAPASAEGSQEGVTVEEPESSESEADASSSADPTEGAVVLLHPRHAIDMLCCIMLEWLSLHWLVL